MGIDVCLENDHNVLVAEGVESAEIYCRLFVVISSDT